MELSKNKKPNLIYFIGPNFTVHSLAKESLKSLSKKYNIICVSEGPAIEELFFIHEVIKFKRNPSLLYDLISLCQIFSIVNQYKDAFIVTSTPKISFIVSLVSFLLRRDYRYIHRGAVYQNFSGIKAKIYKNIDKFIIKNSFATSFISKSLYNYVTKELGLNIENNRVLNSSKGVDIDLFQPRNIGKINNPIVVGYLGRVCEDKGLDDLLNLINDKRSKNIKIKIQGRLEIKDRNSFLKELSNNNIEYTDWDDRPEKFFNKIDILFFPSKREGFGNVAMEAAAMGIPTVANNIIGVKDAIENEVSGILVNKDESIIEKLFSLIENEDYLIDLKTTSRLHAEKNFDQQKVLYDLHSSLKI